jgi:AraC-like DNA-binding protein
VKGYSLYLPEPPTANLWQCTARSIGYERVDPYSAYPPRRHPVDHLVNLENGRVLSAYQFVFVTEGRGLFECERSPKRQRVEPGTIIIVFPGIWHRYAPDPEVGWVEQWLECSGAIFDRAQNAGYLKPEHSLLRVGLLPDLLRSFDYCHALAQQHSPGLQSLLSTMGLHLLSLVLETRHAKHEASRSTDEKVRQGQVHLANRYSERLNVEQLANGLKVSYSSFRQAFKQRTGTSPKQYQLQIRLQKAQDLLVNTSKTVAEIAEILGFNSAFHFSKQFKNRVGLAPNAWRRTLAGHRILRDDD